MLLFSFDEQVPLPSKTIKRRFTDYNLDVILRPFRHHPFLTDEDCIIDNGKGSGAVDLICDKISRRERRRLWRTFDARFGQSESAHLDSIRRFQRMKRKLITEGEFEAVSQRKRFQKILSNAQIRKKIRKLTDALNVISVRRGSGRSLRSISKDLGISESRVGSIWTRTRGTNGLYLKALFDELNNQITQYDALITYFNKRQDDEGFLNTTLRKGYEDLIHENGRSKGISFSEYYSKFKEFGFRQKTIRYVRKVPRPVARHQMANFIEAYLYFLLHEEKFELLFMDESSINPSNFKKMQWTLKGRRTILASSIKYEKIMIIGAMNRRQVVGVQFLNSNFGSIIFSNFMPCVTRQMIQHLSSTHQLVIFLDNCSSHKSKEFASFCEVNNIILMFNLPHMSPLNPIEYLWEFVKRDFRKMTDYHK